jgi:hypothetical protein
MADRPTTLVTALGDEPLAPLVLARHLRARRVICVGRPVVEWRVEPLLAILRREGCETAWLRLDAADVPAGLMALEARLGRAGPDGLVFDLTNAHGIVGFALYELARRRESDRPTGSRMVRIDWSDRLVRSVSPDHAAAEPIRVRVELAPFLELYGKRLVGVERARGSAGAYGPAAQRIARALPAARPLLEAAHRGGWDKPLRLRPRPGTAALVRGLVADGVLRTGRLRDDARRDTAFAADLRAFQFLHGRWLEEYLFEVADGSGRFDDCASGVRFNWSVDGSGHADVANEIDFAGTAAGRATIASCKTGFRDAAGPLYELLTLAERAAGRSVVPVFATSEVLDHAARRRAAALGVRVLDAERLPDEELVLATLLGEPGRIPAAPPVDGSRATR